MKALTASEARANLYRLIDQSVESHEPIIISGRRNSAVLLSADAGVRFKKPCTFWRCQACASRSRRVWPSLSQNRRSRSSGKLGTCLFQASSEGCQDGSCKRAEVKGAGINRCSWRRPIANPATLQVVGRRYLRRRGKSHSSTMSRRGTVSGSAMIPR